MKTVRVRIGGHKIRVRAVSKRKRDAVAGVMQALSRLRG